MKISVTNPYHNTHSSGFMFYRNNLEDTIVEWCPNCCYEVNIKNVIDTSRQLYYILKVFWI